MSSYERVRSTTVRLFRDTKQRRKAVVYEPGDAVLVWGPVTAGAPYKKAKFLYQWSNPHVVKEKVSDVSYRLLREKDLKASVRYETTPPIHVNRLLPYTPLGDGSPSISTIPPQAVADTSRSRRSCGCGSACR